MADALKGSPEKAEAQPDKARLEETSAIHDFEMLEQSIEGGMSRLMYISLMVK